MYPFVTHTWNPIRGRCPHQCTYCYMKGFNVGELRLVDKELQTNLGSGNFIFVGSSCDMWAREVPTDWIIPVLVRCRNFDNTYLFQSKNPERWLGWDWQSYGAPIKSIWGTTIETNRDYGISEAPTPLNRYQALKQAIIDRWGY